MVKEMGKSKEFFREQGGTVFCEGCSLESMARSVPTPFYVYSEGYLLDRYRRLDQAFSGTDHVICYSFKANAQPDLLRLLKEVGAGAEVVSGGELALALHLGFSPEKIVFSGVGKTDEELQAGLDADICLFTVESEGELTALERLASRCGRRAKVGIRINPDIDARTHPHISTAVQRAKFGLDQDEALSLYRRGEEFPHIKMVGIHVHLGSQITSIEPFTECAAKLEKIVDELRSDGVPLTVVDWGGGLGFHHEATEADEVAPTFEDYARQVLPWMARASLRLILEPGRVLIGPTGALVVRILYLKRVHGYLFAVTDSGMTDLLRPALYDAYHRIEPITRRNGQGEPLDVVGGVCESSDVFGRSRRLGDVQSGDLLAIMDTGAYGFSMSSNYNLRPKPAEVVVEGDRFRVVRKKQTTEELVNQACGKSL